MPFFTEPDHYEKTILSDLQGAWEVLRAAVADHAGFPNWERVLFHTDQAMSWETVRHLERMEPLRLLIRNLAVQGDAPAEVSGGDRGDRGNPSRSAKRVEAGPAAV